MGVEQVVSLLKIANNDLPLVEHKCERLKREVDDLEANKHNSARILQEISDQVTYLRNICKEQSLDLTRLQMQKVRLEGLVDSFQNNNEEYRKIRNTVEQKIHSVLSDRRMLLSWPFCLDGYTARENDSRIGCLQMGIMAFQNSTNQRILSYR